VRILFLNPGARLGGAERSLLDWMAALRRHAEAAELALTVSEDGPLVEEARRLGGRCHVLPMPRGLERVGGQRDPQVREKAIAAVLAAGYAVKLRRLVVKLAPTVVHSNGVKFHLLSALAVPSRTPLVWHVRDYLGLRHTIAPALKLASRRVTRAVAVSYGVERDLRALLPGLTVATIHAGIDTDWFCPGATDGELLDALATRPSPEPGALRIGLVGTFAHWKGHGLFFEAIARLAQRTDLPAMHFYVIGGAIYRTANSQVGTEDLSASIARLGIGGMVSSVPFQAEMPDLYRALDIVVHASTAPEPFGRTVAEAMACGRPVVCTDATGVRELFLGGDAVEFRRGAAQALADAIAALAGDGPRRAALGCAARATAQRQFSLDRLAPQALDFYRQIIARRR